jgi:peptide chain release factor
VQEERSQHQNRRIALVKLALLLKEQEDQRRKITKQGAWSNHLNLQRGEAIKTFVGKEFLGLKV